MVPPSTDAALDRSAPGAPTVAAAPSLPIGAALFDVARSRWLPPLLAFGWACLVWAGSQFPQLRAPLLTADGLDPGAHAAMQALGLASIAGSTAFWLLAALTVGALLLRVVAARDKSIETQATAVSPEGAGSLAVLVEQQLADALSRERLGTFARLRSSRHGDARAITAGHGRLGVALQAVGLLAWATAALLAAHSPTPVRLQVPITSTGTLASVPAWSAGPGRPVPARGYFEAACTRAADGIRCDIDAFGARGKVDLGTGRSAELGAWTVTWTHSRTALDSHSWNLRWLAGDEAASGRWYAFDARSGHHASVAKLGLSLMPLRTERSGPIAMGAVRRGGTSAFLAAGPGLLPDGLPSLRVASGGHVQLLLTRAPGGLWFLLGALLLLAGAFLSAATPSVRALIHGDGRVAVSGCNRDSLRVAVEAAQRGRA